VERNKQRLTRIYRDLTVLLTPFLVKSFRTSRDSNAALEQATSESPSPKGLTTDSTSSGSAALDFEAVSRSWHLEIYNSEEAQKYFEQFIQPDSDAEQIQALYLGRVDGFHPHQNACETDNGIVAGRGLLATHGDALEPLQFAHRLFDPGARPV
jgi:hypothetical protein